MSKLLLSDFIEAFESINKNHLFIVSKFRRITRQMIKLMETTLNDNILKVCFCVLLCDIIV
jgi:hypothetical protein